jgi:hypothetical protein
MRCLSPSPTSRRRRDWAFRMLNAGLDSASGCGCGRRARICMPDLGEEEEEACMCLIGVGGMRGCWGERGGYLFSSGPFLLLLKPVVPAAVCLSVMLTLRRGRTCTFLIRPLCSSSLYLVCCPDIPFGLWSLLFPVLVCLVYGCQLDLIACVSCSWLSSSTCWAAYILTLHIGVGNNNIY